MSGALALQERAKAIRERLRCPPNAVPDSGIDLRRRFKEPEPPPTVPEPDPQPHPPIIVKIIEIDLLRRVSVAAIQRAIAAHYNLSVWDLKGPCRIMKICFPRQVGMYMACMMIKRSIPFIGREFNRDHSTVLHARDKIAALVKIDAALEHRIQFIREAILAGHFD